MNWLTKISGQAIQVTPSMTEFAKDVANIIYHMTNEEFSLNIQKSSDIYNGQINCKYGTFDIEVVIKPNSESGGNVAIAETFSNTDKEGRIIFYMDSQNEYKFKTLYYTTLHEIVHLIDPKYEKRVTDMPKWKIYNPPAFTDQLNHKVPPEYYLKPEEQDAFMAEMASKLIDRSKQLGLNKAKILQHIRDYNPRTKAEEIWYKYPKIWRKYMNTLYQAIERAYANE